LTGDQFIQQQVAEFLRQFLASVPYEQKNNPLQKKPVRSPTPKSANSKVIQLRCMDFSFSNSSTESESTITDFTDESSYSDYESSGTDSEEEYLQHGWDRVFTKNKMTNKT
jgi:hypothetical protein